MNRRAFGTFLVKGAATLGLANLLTFTTACPSWVTSLYLDILKYVPVGLSAFSVILNILSGAGIIPPGSGTVIAGLIALVKSGFADLQTAITQYQNAPAAGKASLLGAITTALTVLETDIQTFWANLTIPDGTLASLIEGLLGVIISTLTAFGAALPTPVNSPVIESTKQRRAVLGSKIIVVAPHRRTVKQFKEHFNKELTAGGYGQDVLY